MINAMCGVFIVASTGGTMWMVSPVVIETDDVWARVYRDDPFQLVDLSSGHFVGSGGVAHPANAEKPHHGG
jgi:hypothetical protein